ncbi:MAG: hypothetical protein ACK40K_03205 [Raineya sp.]
MIKNYFLGLCILLLFNFSACKDEEIFDGIFVTGDHTTVLRVWKGEINGSMNIANFQDSSKITYPAYWLSISDKYAVFHTRADANADRISYYSLSPNLKQNTKDILSVENFKLIYARNIVAGTELIEADETKSVILEGKIEKK